MLNENVRRFAKVACLAVAVILLLGFFLILAESPSIKITATTNDGSTKNLSWWILVFVPLVIASIITTLFSLHTSKKEKDLLQKVHKDELSYAERKSAELEKLNYATNQELIRAQTSIVSQERWKERAIKCNPEIEHLVLESFARDEADNFQKDYPELETLQACHNNYSVFVKALNAYHRLSDEAKTIMALNLETIRQKLRDSLTDYINFARNYLRETDASLEGTPENLEEIAKVITWYENLPIPVKNQIPTTIITSLMMKKANAEYQYALISNDIETEVEVKEPSIFDKFLNCLTPKISHLWSKFKNWFKKKKDDFFNYFTRPLEYDYKDEILEEYEEECSIKPTSDDTIENPDYN